MNLRPGRFRDPGHFNQPFSGRVGELAFLSVHFK